MPNEVTRDEFQHLDARLTVVEQEVEGEKMVTRHILEQTRRNGDDLAAVKKQQKLDGIELKALVQKVDGLDRKVDDLTKSLPRIVGDAVRDVLRDRKA